jgi:hypothetical protein
MKAVRTVLGVLAIIPVALLADRLLFHPAEYDEDALKKPGLSGIWRADLAVHYSGVVMSRNH